VQANLLQFEALNLSPAIHLPFHRRGTSPMPSSLKLADSGHIPAKCKPPGHLNLSAAMSVIIPIATYKQILIEERKIKSLTSI
jgi:hypothetical protein